MPHIIIEYTRDVEDKTNIQQLVQEAFEGARESGLFTPAAIKARAIPIDHYWTGGMKSPAVCTEVKLLPGRTPEMKKDLSQQVFDRLAAKLDETIALSVEISDLDGDSYLKRG